MSAARSVHPSSVSISTLLSSSEQQLFRQFPEYQTRLQSLISLRFSLDTTAKTTPSTSSNFTSSLTPEEIYSVVEKIQQLSQLPGLTFDSETELYLEQQLEDILGFGISTTNQGIKLRFIKGSVESLPHLYSVPSMKVSEINQVREAGLDTKRPFFGWQLQSVPDGNEKENTTDYWVALPLRSFIDSTKQFSAIKKWSYKRKMLVINPSEAVYSVAEVLNDYSNTSTKYQFGASPALIRETLVWSPQNLGRVLVFFIADTNNSPAPGVYSLLK